MDGLDEIKEIFFVECGDLLGELNGKLADVEAGDSDVEDLNAIFRAVHSIKGGAGSFGLTELIDFAHIFENVLDMLRSGTTELDDDMTSLMLQSADVLTDLVQWSQEGVDIDASGYAPVLARLEEIYEGGKEDSPELENFVFAPVSIGVGDGADGGALAPPMDFSAPLPDLDAPAPAPDQGFVLKFTPTHDLSHAGLNSFRLLDDLVQAGATDIVVHDDAVPPMDAFDPNAVYIYWTMRFPAGVTQEVVEDVLFFALDKCDLEFTPIGGAVPASDPAADLPDLPDLPPLDEAPVADLPPLPDLPTPANEPAPTNEDEAPVESEAQTVEVKEKAEDPKPIEDDKPAKSSSIKKAPPPTIRVVLDKIDRLINQVGELVVTQAMLDETISEAGLERDPAIMSTITDFRQLTVDIQESVMAIRAQPIRSLFQRMGRVVRESAQAVGKNAKLVLEGEYTEVDNTMIESLADPLMHMLRNAVDHGLEKPEDRDAAGKPKQGIVTLSAAHRGGKVVIEVRDDGAGINRPKVKSIAEEKGLIEPDANLSDAEIDNLLFMPGFSTADNVSTLSGRGVGMDVVKRSIMDVGGKVAIRSTPGQGSCITITLPLTLAILDGMLIRVGVETLVLPLTSVVETVLVPDSAIHTMSGSRMVDIRGSLLPLIDLADHMGFPTNRAANAPTVAVIAEADGDRWCALQVDAIIDQRQVVIKSLEENFGRVEAVSAATILGDGRLALIADVEQLSDLMVARTHIEQDASAGVRKVANG